MAFDDTTSDEFLISVLCGLLNAYNLILQERGQVQFWIHPACDKCWHNVLSSRFAFTLNVSWRPAQKSTLSGTLIHSFSDACTLVRCWDVNKSTDGRLCYQVESIFVVYSTIYARGIIEEASSSLCSSKSLEILYIVSLVIIVKFVTHIDLICE